MRDQYHDRPREQGAIGSFIIVSLVLIGLFIGGVVLIKNRADHIANTPPQIAQEATPEPVNDTSDNEEAQTPVPEESESTPAPVPSTDPAEVDEGSEIAATGPTETFVTMFGLGLLTAAVTRYVQSRSRTAQQ